MRNQFKTKQQYLQRTLVAAVFTGMQMLLNPAFAAEDAEADADDYQRGYDNATETTKVQ